MAHTAPDAAGADLGNGTGIRINGGFNLIRGNRIDHNAVDGILLSGADAEGNRIEDNLIGGGVATVGFATGNGRMGVMVQSEAYDNEIRDNTIGCNGDDGVRIMPSAGGRNTVAGNRIARNSALGIDLGTNGVSGNDNDPAICDPALGCAANRGQNFPVLDSAERRHSGMIPIGRPVRVQGTLRSIAGGPYRLEVFGGDSCEANGHGEGQRPLGAQTLTITTAPYCPPGNGFCIQCVNFNCTAPFTLWLPEIDVVPGNAITITATSPNGDTSEFSACMTLTEEPGQPGGDAIFADGFED
ncbi:right-handed parallel beta-helix repeat-containing protein [Xanthomonadaceae bacterium XH05]|nr:right-handed parallel beta-helix repeat-containing protein [Xanthomonadaceae bacterium XH05]